MKIVGFEADGKARLGVIEGDQVIDLQAVDPNLSSNLADVLAATGGDVKPLADLAAKAPASARRPLAGLKFALPVARPGKILCLGLNYLDHVKEGPNRDNIPKFPTLFMRGLNSVVPHKAPIIRPKVSETFDYEAEMVAVVGKRARHMTMDNALSCIMGYTISNEGSIREFQRHTTQWHMGKNFDNSGSIGPWIVTADELPARRQGAEDRKPRQRQGHAVRQHGEHDVPAGRDHRLRDAGHDAGARRHDPDRHAVRRRACAQAAGLDAPRRHRRDRDRGHRHPLAIRSRTKK